MYEASIIYIYIVLSAILMNKHKLMHLILILTILSAWGNQWLNHIEKHFILSLLSVGDVHLILT
jgi:hypothetical protein